MENTKTEENKASVSTAFEVSKKTSLVLQEIYRGFREEASFNLELLQDITANSEYTYILMNLYHWGRENKLLNILTEFYLSSASSYRIRYQNVSEFVKKSFDKLKNSKIIETTALAIEETDFSDFIRDFGFLDHDIFRGLKKRLLKNEISYETVRKMTISGVLAEEIIGSRCYSHLSDPDFNLNHMISHTKDEVLIEVIKQIKGDEYSNQLVRIILKRGLLDELAAEAIRKLDISSLEQKDLQRIYSLFYISPLNYIKYKIYQYGFQLDEHMAIDLIKELENLYSEELFENVTGILNNFDMTQSCYNQIIRSLNVSNFNYKKWALRAIKTENISLPFFIKLCWFIANEDDLEIVRTALEVMKLGVKYDIIDKWAGSKKFDRLNRRIYPLKMTDVSVYKRMFQLCPSEEEKSLLKDVYNLDF